MPSISDNVTVNVADELMQRAANKVGIELAAFKNGLDNDYGWVDLFMRDEAGRLEIKQCEAEIREIRNSPLDRDGIKQRAAEIIETYRQFRINTLRKMFTDAQENGGLITGVVPINHPALVFHNVTPEELEEIFSSEAFERGISEKNRQKEIDKRQKRVKELYGVIEKELSPPSRWLYNAHGKPLAYPHGCKWTILMEVWRELAAVCNEPINYRGYAIADDEKELAVWRKLGLDRIHKKRQNLMTPFAKGTSVRVKW